MAVVTHSSRRALLVYPHFARNNLLNFEGMAPFYPGKRAVMPPLGLLTVAALLRERGFDVRLCDENVRALGDEELAWADIVAVSCMHPQRRRACEILDRANALGKLTVVGGPSANICPEYYPQADCVHQGELGDTTEALIEFLTTAQDKPVEQRIFRTVDKTGLDEMPLPALDAVNINDYLMVPLQFSVGCPYTCEFCDIPVIYGRVARLKSPARVLAELEQAYNAGFVGTILFVDDNLIANRKAFRKLLPELQAWQAARKYPYPLTGEATINIARDAEMLAAMQKARFTHLFVGVESPDPDTLKEISKRQNVQDPIVESLRVIEDHGMEPILGMILGFDTDKPDTGDKVARFIAESNAPIVYFNLLAALPKTPLWERMEREGRLLAGEGGDAQQSESLLSCATTNVRFKLDNAQVVQMLRDAVREVYSPREVFRRFRWLSANVYGKQVQGVPPTATREQVLFTLRFTAGTLANVVWGIGVKSPYRGEFWRYLAELVRLRARGQIASVLEVLLRTTPNAYHLAEWGRVLLEDTSGAEAARAADASRTASGTAATRVERARREVIVIEGRGAGAGDASASASVGSERLVQLKPRHATVA